MHCDGLGPGGFGFVKIGEAIGSVTGYTGFVCGLWLAHGWIRDLESGTEGFCILLLRNPLYLFNSLTSFRGHW